jgi:hypothetical protein
MNKEKLEEYIFTHNWMKNTVEMYLKKKYNSPNRAVVEELKPSEDDPNTVHVVFSHGSCRCGSYGCDHDYFDFTFDELIEMEKENEV